MCETLEYFRQVDSRPSGMDPYDGRVQLTVDVKATYAENGPFTVRGVLTRDGQPYPGIAWPRDDDRSLDTTALPVNTAIMGIQVDKPATGSPLHWELEMTPDGRGGFTATDSNIARITGDFVFKVVAEAIYEQAQAPQGKVAGFFRTLEGSFRVVAAPQQQVRTDVWIAGSLGSAGVSADLRHRTQFRRVDRDNNIVTASGHLVMPMIPRVPNANIGNGGLVIDNRRIALDSQTGDSYAIGYESVIGPEILERFRENGARQQLSIAGLDLSALSALTVDSRGRKLWLGFPSRLVQVDLNSLQVTKTVSDVGVAMLKDDPSTDGIWAVVVLGAPQRRIRLVHYAADGSVDFEVAQLEPNRRPGFLAPLQSGGAVVVGTHKRVPQLVSVDNAGKIVNTGGRLTFGLVDVAANTMNGDVWAVIARNERRGFLQKYRPDLTPDGPAIDPRVQFQGIDSLISVAVSSGSEEVWVAGLKFNPNPPPGTPPGPLGGVGRVDKNLAFTAVPGSHQAIALVRSFG